MSYIPSFVVAMVVSMALLPPLIYLGRRFSFVDTPAPRKVHSQPVPRIGGPAIFAGVLAASILTLPSLADPRLYWLLAAASLVLATGVLDDRLELGFRPKLAAQVLAAILVVYGAGVRIDGLSLPEFIVFPGWVADPLSVFAIVAITNAVALSDGLDGLAGGIVFLCCSALGLLSFTTANTDATVIAVALAGAIFGFLRFNTHPASIFMGDSGSQFLGLASAILAIQVTQAANGQIGAALPLLLLAVPIMDTAQVIVVRLASGASPFVADRRHLHHRLLSLGFQHRSVVLTIYILQCVFFLLAYFLRFQSDAMIMLVFIIALTLMMVTLFVVIRRRRLLEPAHEPVPKRRRVRSFLRTHANGFARVTAVGVTLYVVLFICAVSGGYLKSGPDAELDVATAYPQVQTLMGAMLAIVVVSMILDANTVLGQLQRSIGYVLAATLAFASWLVDWPDSLRIAELTLVAIIGLSSAFWLALGKQGDSQLTTLDLLILFGAFTIPNLPGLAEQTQSFASVSLRLISFFYAAEVINSGLRQKFESRLPLLVSLALLALHPFFIDLSL